MTAGVLVGAVVVLAVLVLIWMFNGLVRSRNKCDNGSELGKAGSLLRRAQAENALTGALKACSPSRRHIRI
jgi:hypothetical protein